jgi:2'-5' RNA ligase
MANVAVGRSAVVVAFRLPPELERIRQDGDPVARLGVPAHVTIGFPFLPRAALVPAVRTRLAAIAATEYRFDVSFLSVRRWPDVVWLAPEPTEPFRRLTERLTATFPDNPPYADQFQDIVPHLTLARGDVIADITDDGLASMLPVRGQATAMVVLVESPTGRWRRSWRLNFRP